MLKSAIVLLVAILAGACSQEETSPPTPPQLIEFTAGELVSAVNRNVSLWLPPGYEESTDRYPVLYMHDGQNLFTPGRAYGGEEWGVDETLSRLIAEDTIPPVIVVGIWNTEDRFLEYAPTPLLEALTPADRMPENATGMADAYLAMIVEDLKPHIDQSYRTLSDAKNTYAIGSSMGGLISLYAFTEYKEVFGAAGCLSTHWPMTLDGDNLTDPAWQAAATAAIRDYLTADLPVPDGRRIWFDYGTEALDQFYEPYQLAVDEVMTAAGYSEGEHFVSKRYDGAPHNEAAWRARFDEVVTFLLNGDSEDAQ